MNHFLETGQYTTPRLGRRSRPGKILANHLDFLIDHLHSVDATLYLDEMQSLLIRFFGRLYSVPLICATLIRRGVTRKKLSLIAARRNDYERLVYSNFIREHVTASQVLCFDEARIDPRSEERNYGRGLSRRVRGLRAMTRGQSGFSCLCVMSLEGVLSVAVSRAKGITGPM